MSDLVKRYTASVFFDKRLWQVDIAGSLAHASIGKDMYDCLSLRGSLNARNSLGCTAPAQVRLQIARH